MADQDQEGQNKEDGEKALGSSHPSSIRRIMVEDALVEVEAIMGKVNRRMSNETFKVVEVDADSGDKTTEAESPTAVQQRAAQLAASVKAQLAKELDDSTVVGTDRIYISGVEYGSLIEGDSAQEELGEKADHMVSETSEVMKVMAVSEEQDASNKADNGVQGLLEQMTRPLEQKDSNTSAILSEVGSEQSHTEIETTSGGGATFTIAQVSTGGLTEAKTKIGSEVIVPSEGTTDVESGASSSGIAAALVQSVEMAQDVTEELIESAPDGPASQSGNQGIVFRNPQTDPESEATGSGIATVVAQSVEMAQGVTEELIESAPQASESLSVAGALGEPPPKPQRALESLKAMLSTEAGLSGQEAAGSEESGGADDMKDRSLSFITEEVFQINFDKDANSPESFQSELVILRKATPGLLIPLKKKTRIDDLSRSVIWEEPGIDLPEKSDLHGGHENGFDSSAKTGKQRGKKSLLYQLFYGFDDEDLEFLKAKHKKGSKAEKLPLDKESEVIKPSHQLAGGLDTVDNVSKTTEPRVQGPPKAGGQPAELTPELLQKLANRSGFVPTFVVHKRQAGTAKTNGENQSLESFIFADESMEIASHGLVNGELLSEMEQSATNKDQEQEDRDQEEVTRSNTLDVDKFVCIYPIKPNQSEAEGEPVGQSGYVQTFVVYPKRSGSTNNGENISLESFIFIDESASVVANSLRHLELSAKTDLGDEENKGQEDTAGQKEIGPGSQFINVNESRCIYPMKPRHELEGGVEGAKTLLVGEVGGHHDSEMPDGLERTNLTVQTESLDEGQKDNDPNSRYIDVNNFQCIYPMEPRHEVEGGAEGAKTLLTGEAGGHHEGEVITSLPGQAEGLGEGLKGTDQTEVDPNSRYIDVNTFQCIYPMERRQSQTGGAEGTRALLVGEAEEVHHHERGIDIGSESASQEASGFVQTFVVHKRRERSASNRADANSIESFIFADDKSGDPLRGEKRISGSGDGQPEALKIDDDNNAHEEETTAESDEEDDLPPPRLSRQNSFRVSTSRGRPSPKNATVARDSVIGLAEAAPPSITESEIEEEEPVKSSQVDSSLPGLPDPPASTEESQTSSHRQLWVNHRSFLDRRRSKSFHEPHKYRFKGYRPPGFTELVELRAAKSTDDLRLRKAGAATTKPSWLVKRGHKGGAGAVNLENVLNEIASGSVASTRLPTSENAHTTVDPPQSSSVDNITELKVGESGQSVQSSSDKLNKASGRRSRSFANLFRRFRNQKSSEDLLSKKDTTGDVTTTSRRNRSVDFEQISRLDQPDMGSEDNRRHLESVIAREFRSETDLASAEDFLGEAKKSVRIDKEAAKRSNLAYSASLPPIPPKARGTVAVPSADHDYVNLREKTSGGVGLMSSVDDEDASWVMSQRKSDRLSDLTEASWTTEDGQLPDVVTTTAVASSSTTIPGGSMEVVAANQEMVISKDKPNVKKKRFGSLSNIFGSSGTRARSSSRSRLSLFRKGSRQSLSTEAADPGTEHGSTHANKKVFIQRSQSESGRPTSQEAEATAEVVVSSQDRGRKRDRRSSRGKSTGERTRFISLQRQSEELLGIRSHTDNS